MSQLFMGKCIKEKNTDSKGFVLKADKTIERHMFVTGQSGCGKSSLLGRLIEEIILRDAGHVLLLDCNYEFSCFGEVNDSTFRKKKKYLNPVDCLEDNLGKFKSNWEDKKSKIVAIKSGDISILYNDIETYLKALLFGIDRYEHPGAFWLLQLIDKEDRLEERRYDKIKFLRLVTDVARWFEGRETREEANELGRIIYEIRQNMSTLDLTRFVNSAKSFCEQSFVDFKSYDEKKTLDKELVKNLFDSSYFCSIDLLDFEYTQYYFRDFVVFHLLHEVWKEAKARFVKKKNNGDVEESTFSPLFIVIDEAHNLAPSNSGSTQSLIAQEVLRLIRTIAAEGRKFGLFLILVSQRPEKIDESILSECDNFIVMKSTPPSIRHLTNLISKNRENGLNCATSLTPGQAFYYGAFTEYELIKVGGYIKRTR